MARVFISYSRKDNEFVRRLANDLAQLGHEVLYDQNLLAGDSWVSVLSAELRRADFVVAVLSAKSIESTWARQEWLAALQEEIETRRVKLIPVKLDEAAVPPILAAKNYIDFTGDYQPALETLLRTLSQERSAQALPERISEEQLQSVAEEIAPKVEAFQSKAAAPKAPPLPPGKKRCFMVMPFNIEALDVVYEDFVKPIAENECGLEVERGDDIFGSNPIMDDILASINASDLVIADLTGKNANVFYEVGICHALNKNVLLMAQSIDDVPFDLRHRRVLVYEYSPRGCKRLEGRLREHLKAMLAKAAAA